MNDLFESVEVNIVAEGQFFDILQFIKNIYQLPIKFSVRGLTLKQQPNSISMEFKLVLVLYKLESES